MRDENRQEGEGNDACASSLIPPPSSLTGADALVRRLCDHGVRHVFGYPGGPLAPVYDALQREPALRHILSRHEQGAGFMADGYARATGQPGVCLAVCGPGVFNAATALATAFTDSIPVLLITGQVPTGGLGLRSGYYHENDQLAALASLTKGRARVTSAQSMAREIDLAFETMTTGRPGPFLLEAPLDVLREEFTPTAWAAPRRPASPPVPHGQEITALVELLAGWQRPLILAGGGVIASGAGALLVQVAERLGAPVFTTLMGKGAIASDHPLAAGLPWYRSTSDLTSMEPFFSPLFTQADGVLAVGCRFTQAATGNWKLPLTSALAQIDIDPAEIGRHYPVALGMKADAGAVLHSLLTLLPDRPRLPWAAPSPLREPWRLQPDLDLLGPLRRVLPRDAILVADITRLAYIMLAEFPVYYPRTFLHPAGFVSMGYGLPAALGAKTAFPQRMVAAVVGDGCFQMSGMELATMVQEKLPVLIILLNDGSLSLIKAIQERHYQGRILGVDLVNPDFGQLARAFGVRSWQVDSDAAFETALGEAVAHDEPALVEVRIGKAG